jgi:2-polyprenyl-6-hydroxyphenyl methylase/3-demethylubiquinone-9 3-methyltransferase
LIEHKSIFELPADPRWDVVYSWGVLHHTGNMWAAIERAAAQVAPGGVLAIALYRRTPLCTAWAVEKRLYSGAPAAAQACMRALFKGMYLAGVIAGGRSPSRYIKEYHARGMDWHHDVHDWLGGYPYESTAPDEVVSFLTERGFELERSFTHPARAAGLFGSHCDEFVARKIG